MFCGKSFWKRPYQDDFCAYAQKCSYSISEIKIHDQRFTSTGTLFRSRDARGTLVFFHGTGNDRFFPYIHLFRAVLSAHLDLLTINLPGHGVSDSGALSIETLEIFWQLVAEVVASYRNVSFAGDSLGGLTAISIANRINPRAPFFAISPPAKVKITPRVYAREILGLLRSKGARGCHRFYGLYGSLPAVGKFKRDEFPIRLNERKKSYVQVVAEIVAAMDLSAVPNAHSGSVIAVGSYDSVIGSVEDWKRVVGTRQDIMSVHPFESHASHLFSQVLVDRFKNLLDSQSQIG